MTRMALPCRRIARRCYMERFSLISPAVGSAPCNAVYCQSRLAIEEAILQHMEQGGHAVLPADFLALFVGAAVISDGHFVNPAAQPGYLDGDFGLKSEAVGTQVDGLQYLAAEGFVAHFHVVEVEVAKQVAEEGQKAIGLEVPEIEHAVGAAVKAVAEDRVGVPAEDGLQQYRVVGRVIFQIGVLHQDDVAAGLSEAGA